MTEVFSGSKVTANFGEVGGIGLNWQFNFPTERTWSMDGANIASMGML